MIAYLLTDAGSPRVLLADEPMTDAERARLTRAGIQVREVPCQRTRSADDLHDAVTPMLQRSLFG